MTEAERNAGAPITIYGIKSCDTMKKARAWLDDHGVDYVFHDYKAAGIERARLERWAAAVGWERLLNRAGTTFRKLAAEDKQDLGEKKAVDLMLSHPTLIKRPVIELGGSRFIVGFKPDDYAKALAPRRGTGGHAG
ncbi:MAG TPA: ArsC family reductase [Gammaproteobacteria bacterium]|nr:ArsC family reductase [Gammaproteobacteria bacterium]